MFNSSLNLSLSKFTLVDVFNAQCVVVSLAVTGGSSIGVCGGLCKPSWLLGRDLKFSSWPQPRGPKNWPRPWPRDYWPRPHDNLGFGLVQLGLVAS